uniref:Arm DNA-binding domain-containing protein n=1 Tax=Rheinheimera sp. TaxID=1869214 RepID=UPI0040485A59
MGKISVRRETARLYYDFMYRGRRCREQTTLLDNKGNRKKLEKHLQQIEAEIQTGTFNYAKHFPNSSYLSTLAELDTEALLAQAAITATRTPLFAEFVEEWYQENVIQWRKSYQISIRGSIDKYYLPAFGTQAVGDITRADLLKFRSNLAKVPGRSNKEALSNNRINKIMDPLRRIFDEAADRFNFNTPFTRIKPLKVPKSDVQPFSLDEVNLILEKCRSDYRNYYIVRFFTGMRTGEIDGLKWRYVDFTRGLILVRETIVAGEDDYTKNDFSQRDIKMIGPVLDAMRRQFRATGNASEYVFCNREGKPLEHNNVTKRVWYPLLNRLGLEKRRPYQTRHTAATLWLAAGESPEWIARQMGHSTTEMLFKTYSRFVPNLTRNDGSAFEQLLTSTLGAAL